MNEKYKLKSPFSPTGDQPEAIKSLTNGVLSGKRMQTLLGVTGSGKTFTMANVIANLNRPALILEPNKTLAAQLCGEMREFFPENAVEYFVSYYDYYQPEAYIPGKDMYIEKDALINDEIDKLRHSATSALFERRDVIIVASVSCIYSLGDPNEYQGQLVSVRPGQEMGRNEFIARLISIGYERNDIGFERTKFRVRGDTVDVIPSRSGDTAVRVEFFGDEVDRISNIDIVTGEVKGELRYAAIFPATHYVSNPALRDRAYEEIEAEMKERAAYFRAEGKLIEAQRIEERTRYDLTMMREIGYCSGVENYSRVLSGREPGATPYTLLDYFPRDFIMFIDESHVAVPQVRGMSGGDRARKQNLVDFGFRLPSAFDNRPLNFGEFESKLGQVIFVSATPGEYERTHSSNIAEQLIRPTGLVDPEVEVRDVKTQIDDVLGEIRQRAGRNERSLVVTLTTKMAEDITEYFESCGVRVRYIHHEIETMERTEILRDLRLGEFDALVGINLLREGIDLPEVSLVAILDADKEGFLRNETSLIQTIGRAARNAGGKVILYAAEETKSIRAALAETNRRREIQLKYNEEHGITPTTIKKDVRELISLGADDKTERGRRRGKQQTKSPSSEHGASIETLTQQMREAAGRLDFERAAYLRDLIKGMKK
ncbi:MAG: excinuclease ABC subunit UvrB [Clostridiales bacterium]|nr:excinuclease ABC subunit UvrB [Clostridiales bacterium]